MAARVWLPAALVAVATFAVGLAEAAGPKPGGAVAFWAPRAADLPAAAAVADAIEGRIARAGGFPGWWVLAAKPGADPGALYRAGAWLVVDAGFLNACTRLAGGDG